MSNKVIIGILVFFLVIVMAVAVVMGVILINSNSEDKLVNNENIEENEEDIVIDDSNEQEDVIKEENKTETNNKNENENENNIDKTPTTNDVNISDNWEDGEFLYNGKKVDLICNFKVLEKDLGLKFKDEKKNELVLNPNYTTSGGGCTVGNSENIVVGLLNVSEDIKKYPECDVDYFSTNIYNLKRDNDHSYSKLKLSKGITWDSTLEDVISAYGEPKRRSDSEKFSILYYESSTTRNKLELTIYKEYGLTSFMYSIKK